MKTKDVIEKFGNMNRVARALNITRAAVLQWGTLVPQMRAHQLQMIFDEWKQSDSDKQKQTNEENVNDETQS